MGLMIWAEDGFVNGSYEPEVSAGIVREMVRQYYNHPSIFCWSAANEPAKTNRPAVSDLLGVLKAEADPRRLITYNNTHEVDFADPQADFWTKSNMPGWYPNSGDVWTTRFPYINQVGAGGVITHQCDYMDRYHKISGFEPEGYQQYLGEIVTKRAYEDLDYFLLFWWQMKDVDAENFRGILNTKGLMTFGGYRKDLYYLFQSCLRQDMSVLHICGKHWFIRGTEGNAIKVYSNSKQVKLLVNRTNCGELTNGENYSIDGRLIRDVFYWEHVLVPGRNEITATDGSQSETCVIHFAPDGIMPAETDSLVADLNAEFRPVWAINRAPEDQWPVYAQFDGNSCNTFDAIPEVLCPASSTKITWIVTRRQSAPGSSTYLTFDIASTVDGNSDVWLMVTRKREAPAWISQAGFKDTGLTGQWRNDSTFLVDYELHRKTCRPGESIVLRASGAPTDFAVFVTANERAD
jgi:beta-galactosidase